jgi:uncharacterized protein (TIGR02246 family)
MLTEDDKTFINALLKGMADAWAAGDGFAYSSAFWDDARYVEAPGFRATGKKMIGERHQKVFDTFFKNTRIDGDYPRTLHVLTPDVVLVHSEGNVLFPGETGKGLPPNGLITMVVQKKQGVWKMAAFQNTPAGKLRGIKFFARFLLSRWRYFTAGRRNSGR